MASAPTPYTDEWVEGPLNTKFFTRYQAPETIKGAVLFVHGFIEHSGRYDFVREALVSKGFAVLFYDQRGFGETALNKENKSPGSAYGKNTRTELLGDVEFMLDYLRTKSKSDVLFLYGHSMGGAISLQYACVGKDDLKVKGCLRGVVATSPLIRMTNPAPLWKTMPGHWVAKLMPWKEYPAPVRASALSHDPEVGKAYLADPLVIEKGTLLGLDTMLRGGIELAERHYRSWPENLPVFLRHGSADQVTNPNASKLFYEGIKANHKNFELYQDGYHELHNEPEFKKKLLDEITAWLESHLPSGPVASSSGEQHAEGVASTPDPAAKL